MNCGIYRHYKGPLYQVIGIGEHTETKERVVVYVSLTAGMPGPRIRVRPKDGPEGFCTQVPDEKNKGFFIDRFKYLGDEIE